MHHHHHHHRHARAVQTNTERLQNESNDYTNSVHTERSRARGLQQTIERTATMMLVAEANQEAVEDAFRNEIDMLTSACDMTRKELGRLQTLLREQAVIESQIDLAQQNAAEERNTLALEARAFDDDQKQLACMLTDLREEGQRLSSVQLPLSMYHLSVDTERGLRYPLINDLRLAYRPKGDLNWKEISAAWALAVQLLLSIGTLFGFQSQNWRIVPLSHCAKIIYYPSGSSQAKIFNLGHPNTKGSKALLTWNALLCQVMHHVHKKLSVEKHNWKKEERAHDISPTTIGNISLTKLSELDDASWARAIHYMASNLLWLSNVTSRYLAQQVVLSLDTPARPTSNPDGEETNTDEKSNS